jgi:hypothetical protein
MYKFVTTLSVALIVGLAVASSATTASADSYGRHGGYGGGKGCCGPLPPSFSSNTVYKKKHITKYYDVWRHKKFPRYKKHIHTTKIQPILHIHKVTRVHTKLIPYTVPIKVKLTKRLPDKLIVTTSKVYLKPVCGCSGGYGGYGGGGGYKAPRGY